MTADGVLSLFGWFVWSSVSLCNFVAQFTNRIPTGDHGTEPIPDNSDATMKTAFDVSDLELREITPLELGEPPPNLAGSGLERAKMSADADDAGMMEESVVTHVE